MEARGPTSKSDIEEDAISRLPLASGGSAFAPLPLPVRCHGARAGGKEPEHADRRRCVLRVTQRAGRAGGRQLANWRASREEEAGGGPESTERGVGRLGLVTYSGLPDAGSCVGGMSGAAARMAGWQRDGDSVV